MQMTWFCGESEEEPRAIVGRFIEMRRRSLKVNASKSKVTLLSEEEGLEWEFCIDWKRLGPVSEFKYLRCVLDESGTYAVECSRQVASERRVAGAIRSLVNAKNFQLECASVIY